MDNKQDSWTGQQSKFLRRVTMTVTLTEYHQTHLFGTEVKFERGAWRGPCSGDAGAPLMYKNNRYQWQWVIIGKLEFKYKKCKSV